ncbi:Clc chloride channel [Suhomyces tanzawaensis NRRL Y-17324]|uniref:Clc chloride channel n=1 Tax=Suhomyces tanzawaensis NRRL Y-17324 TaxID=984487 RepID=A0A1E4SR25_9ASCO|nr:Clc chloride channel [Suhomyces tanzawaensis NRRL Y-17324]ODV81951.1 Clc chloride channel [Suhomyces tanzawaensis NRRL Y-17324]
MSAEVSFAIDDDLPTLKYSPGASKLPTYAPVHLYEDNTYIDWCRESLVLPTTSDFQTRKWLTLIVLSLCLGYITTFIDLASVWLNDLKKGVCLSKIDKWSLLDPYLSCPVEDWYDWSRLLFDANGVISNVFINFPIYLIFALIWVAVVSFITVKKVPLIKQSGIPEIKLIISGLNYRLADYLGVRTLLYKIAGLILVVSSGLWLGKEGPLVHVSCCLLNCLYALIVDTKYSNEAVRRELLSAATATGISVAFNAPIGGVLFVLEGLPSFFMPTRIMWNSFISSTVAVVVVNGFKAFTNGTHFDEKDLFQVNFGNFSWLFVEMIPFIFLGIMGGLYGHLFIRFNSFFSRLTFRRNIQSKLCQLLKVSEEYGTYLEMFLLVLITSVLNFPIEIAKLPLNAYLKILFTDCPKETLDSNSSNFMCLPSNGITALKLGYIIIQGFFLSAYTFGVELPGGILMPSLVLGATSGRLVGIISQSIQTLFSWDSLASCTEKSCIVSPSSYAVIGAGAFMAGITKFTMSVVVILFELTGAITYVLPIMLSVVILKFVNDWLSNENIYDTWLKTHFNRLCDGGSPNEGKGDGLVNFTGLTSTLKSRLPNVQVKSIMVPVAEVKCISLVPEVPHTIDSLYSFINDDTHEGYPVILNHSNPVSLGYVRKQDLYTKLASVERSDAIVSFQIENLPKSVLSQQLHYEQSLGKIVQVNLSTETLLIKSNELTPVVFILEAFEKLHLNYLIIMDSSLSSGHVMIGLVDRFVLANLIQLRFESISDLTTYNPNQFDIEDETLLSMREERSSIELVT